MRTYDEIYQELIQLQLQNVLLEKQLQKQEKRLADHDVRIDKIEADFRYLLKKLTEREGKE